MKSIQELKKIVLLTHNSGGTGNYDDEMFNFLIKNNVVELLRIDFPFGVNSVKEIRFERILNGNSVRKFNSIIKFSTPEVVSYIKDFIVGLFYGLRYFKGTDIFVGMDCLLCFVGLLLKKIGYVYKVGYVIVDYSPVRYKSKIINSLYFKLDKYCIYNSDFTIPLNLAMVEGRVRDLGLDRKRMHVCEAQFGNYSLSRRKEDYEKYSRKNIVYFGGILKSKGAQLFVPIAKSLIELGFTDFMIEVIGGGDIDYLKGEIVKANLSRYFNVRGRLEDSKEIENILLNCGIAMAPYFVDDPNSFSYYADPGKVKYYLGCGLPIIITDVPPIAKQIENKQCGLIAQYNAGDFAKKIHSIISDEKIYKKYRNNAIQFGREYDWNLIFNKLFTEITSY